MNIGRHLIPTLSCGIPLAITVVMMGCASPGTKADEDNDSIDIEIDSVADTLEDSLMLFEDEPVSKLADELFGDFFYNFISDIDFQHKRTGGHMKKHKGSIFDRFSTQDFFTVVFDRKSDLYLLKDTTLTSVGVEWIDLDSCVIDRYNFHKINSEWLLTDKKEYSVDESPCAEFYEFYKQFATDHDFQMSSLAENIDYLETAQEGEEAVSSVITHDDWAEFSMEMPTFSTTLVNIDYGQSMENANRKNLLFEGFSNGIYVEYRFFRTDDKWLLKEIEI